jgi:hypothetical protein
MKGGLQPANGAQGGLKPALHKEMGDLFSGRMTVVPSFRRSNFVIVSLFEISCLVDLSMQLSLPHQPTCSVI